MLFLVNTPMKSNFKCWLLTSAMYEEEKVIFNVWYCFRFHNTGFEHLNTRPLLINTSINYATSRSWVKFQFKSYYTAEINFYCSLCSVQHSYSLSLRKHAISKLHYVNQSIHQLFLSTDIKYTDCSAHMQTDYCHRMLTSYELHGGGGGGDSWQVCHCIHISSRDYSAYSMRARDTFLRHKTSGELRWSYPSNPMHSWYRDTFTLYHTVK
jgi:hypothetical protein